MLNTIACFKWVIDEADIRIDAGAKKLVLDRAGYKISAYDRNAIEEAVLLQEKHGGTVSAVTVAPSSAKACLKDVLSRGPDTACYINDPSFADLAPAQTVSILAAGIKAGIEYDLIICGEGSGDLYAQQVGPALAETLGIPCVTYVNKLSYSESDGKITAERKLEDGIEVISVSLPVLVTILPDINAPRIPTLKQVLGAAKKPVKNVTLDALGAAADPCLKTVGIQAAVMDRRQIKFAADTDGIRSAVGALLKEVAIG
ncbi:MAG: electron transfer flavoprotein beta subunit/FixA family protein [Syntrophobacteraceae bacterium]